jgi:uncharacterized protein (TIGR00730 family)
MRVTVFGSARVREGSPEYEEAYRLGRLLGERGDELITGGYGGAMGAASRGAREAGGHVLGVTMKPWADRIQPNEYLTEERAAESLYARIEGLVEGDVLIALSGGAGTLAEVAIAWNLHQMGLVSTKPIILVGERWARMLEAFRELLIVDEHDLDMLTFVPTVDDAVEVMGKRTGDEDRWFG